ncbi:MAG TPA: GntR family transcriptional regulator [Arthrobacter sp.]|nr:GntR family transcriptional regulator [Arthrobacter sp.]
MAADQNRTEPDDGTQVPPSGTTPAPYAQVLDLKRSGPEPLYYQLAQSVERALESGDLPHGSRFLSEREMARELKLTVGTVRSAWAYLERKGLISRQRQTGTYVL